MQQTPNLKLEKYELDDMALLTDGYNRSMDLIDEYAGKVDGKFPITSAEIEDGTINTVDLANGCVTENKIATASVTSDKIAIASVTSDKIATEAITNEKLAEDSVTAFNIVDGEIGDAQIGDEVIQLDKLNPSIFDAKPTENSNNLVRSGGIEERIYNQEINVNYTQHTNFPAATGISNYLTVWISDTGTYFFISGQFKIEKDNTYNLTKIPGVPNNRYGIPLTDSIFENIADYVRYQSTNVNYNDTTKSMEYPATITIGNDGVMYWDIGTEPTKSLINTYVITFPQSKLTLNNFNVEPTTFTNRNSNVLRQDFNYDSMFEVI